MKPKFFIVDEIEVLEAFEFSDPELVAALDEYHAQAAARARRLANQVDESLLLG